MIHFPEGWIETTLDALLVVLESGSRPKGGVRGIASGVPSIGGEHLSNNGGFNFEKIKFVPKEFAANMKKGHIIKNDILVVKDGATTGKVSFVDENFSHERAVVNEHVFICRPSCETNPRFIFRFLYSKEGQDRILSNFKGSAQGGINLSFAPTTKLPLAPVKEQHRIVAKLEKLMVKVDQCKARLVKIPYILKRFRQSVLAAACSGELTTDWRAGNKNVKNPKLSGKENIKNTKGLDNIELQLYESRTRFPIDWDFKAITSLLSKERKGMKTGPFGTALKKNEHREEGVPVLGIENIGYLKFKEGSKIHITIEKAEELSSYEIVPGDIIISRSGTVGELCVVPNNIGEARFSTNIIRLAVNKKAVSPLFICFLFQGCQYVLDQISELCKGSTRDFLNQSILKAISIPIPAISEQKEIVRRVESLFKIADQIEARYDKANAHVNKLTQSILAKAFRGELVPQDPNDESALKLLERIREEREKRKAEGKTKRKHKEKTRSHKKKTPKFPK
jgi:type I restriction enzyme, S subunit